MDLSCRQPIHDTQNRTRHREKLCGKCWLFGSNRVEPCHFQSSRRIMYFTGAIDRHINRYIDRYDDRWSTEVRTTYRSTVDRKSTASLSIETIDSQSRRSHRYILFHRYVMDTRSTLCRSPNDISHRHSKQNCLFPPEQALNVKYCSRENDSCVTWAKSCSKLCKVYLNTE